VLAGPPVTALEATSGAELEVDGVGTLRAPLA
jgi:hypothetical protein